MISAPRAFFLLLGLVRTLRVMRERSVCRERSAVLCASFSSIVQYTCQKSCLTRGAFRAQGVAFADEVSRAFLRVVAASAPSKNRQDARSQSINTNPINPAINRTIKMAPTMIMTIGPVLLGVAVSIGAI